MDWIGGSFDLYRDDCIHYDDLSYTFTGKYIRSEHKTCSFIFTLLVLENIYHYNAPDVIHNSRTFPLHI